MEKLQQILKEGDSQSSVLNVLDQVKEEDKDSKNLSEIIKKNKTKIIEQQTIKKTELSVLLEQRETLNINRVNKRDLAWKEFTEKFKIEDEKPENFGDYFQAFVEKLQQDELSKKGVLDQMEAKRNESLAIVKDLTNQNKEIFIEEIFASDIIDSMLSNQKGIDAFTNFISGSITGLQIKKDAAEKRLTEAKNTRKEIIDKKTQNQVEQIEISTFKENINLVKRTVNDLEKRLNVFEEEFDVNRNLREINQKLEYMNELKEALVKCQADDQEWRQADEAYKAALRKLETGQNNEPFLMGIIKVDDDHLANLNADIEAKQQELEQIKSHEENINLLENTLNELTGANQTLEKLEKLEELQNDLVTLETLEQDLNDAKDPCSSAKFGSRIDLYKLINKYQHNDDNIVLQQNNDNNTELIENNNDPKLLHNKEYQEKIIEKIQEFLEDIKSGNQTAIEQIQCSIRDFGISKPEGNSSLIKEIQEINAENKNNPQEILNILDKLKESYNKLIENTNGMITKEIEENEDYNKFYRLLKREQNIKIIEDKMKLLTEAIEDSKNKVYDDDMKEKITKKLAEIDKKKKEEDDRNKSKKDSNTDKSYSVAQQLYNQIKSPFDNSGGEGSSKRQQKKNKYLTNAHNRIIKSLQTEANECIGRLSLSMSVEQPKDYILSEKEKLKLSLCPIVQKAAGMYQTTVEIGRQFFQAEKAWSKYWYNEYMEKMENAREVLKKQIEDSKTDINTLEILSSEDTASHEEKEIKTGDIEEQISEVQIQIEFQKVQISELEERKQECIEKMNPINSPGSVEDENRKTIADFGIASIKKNFADKS